MSEKSFFRRRHYFIDKKFQTSLTIDFLLIIVIALIAVMLLFLFISQDTVTVGYTGSEVKLLHTSDYFFRTLLLPTLVIFIVSGIVGVIVLILISHRISGPLLRLDTILNEICKGDLTGRYELRRKDQIKKLSDRINMLKEIMNGKVGSIKAQTAEIIRLILEVQKISASHPAIRTEMERPLQEITERLAELQDAADHFKTSDHK